MQRPRTILADDYEPAHEIYAKVLAADVEIVAAVTDGQAAIEAAKTHAPDLILLDISMGTMDGFSVARWLKEQRPDVKIIFLTMHADPAYRHEAARIGAHGYVLKRNAAVELPLAVRAVLSGGTYYAPDSGLA